MLITTGAATGIALVEDGNTKHEVSADGDTSINTANLSVSVGDGGVGQTLLALSDGTPPAQAVTKPFFEVEIVYPKEGDEFAEGKKVPVEYGVTNTGGTSDTQDIVFSVDGQEEAAAAFSLRGRTSNFGESTWNTSEKEREIIERKLTWLNRAYNYYIHETDNEFPPWHTVNTALATLEPSGFRVAAIDCQELLDDPDVDAVTIDVNTMVGEWDTLDVEEMDEFNENTAGVYFWKPDSKKFENVEGVGRVKKVKYKNTLVIDPEVAEEHEENGTIGRLDDLRLLYHELLHGQLLMDEMISNETWRRHACECNLDIDPMDRDHSEIPELEDEFLKELGKEAGNVSRFNDYLKSINITEIQTRDRDPDEDTVTERISLPPGTKWTWDFVVNPEENVESINARREGDELVVEIELRDPDQPTEVDVLIESEPNSLPSGSVHRLSFNRPDGVTDAAELPEDSDVTAEADYFDMTTPREHALEVASENDTDVVNITVVGDGSSNLGARIDDTNSPVEEGNPLTVDATFENTGDRQGAQTVSASVPGLGSDSVSVSIDGGSSTTETFSLPTGTGDAGEHVATVRSENDTDSTTVAVESGVVSSPVEDISDELWTAVTADDGSDGLSLADLGNAIQEYQANPTDADVDGVSIKLSDLGSLIQYYRTEVV